MPTKKENGLPTAWNGGPCLIRQWLSYSWPLRDPEGVSIIIIHVIILITKPFTMTKTLLHIPVNSLPHILIMLKPHPPGISLSWRQ